MSNIIYNGTFDLPVVNPTNNYYGLGSFSTQPDMASALFWFSSFIFVSDLTTLQNGITIYGYPDPSSINMTQYISLEQTSYISQHFTITRAGQYKLTFQYTGRNVYPFNYANIYIDGNQVGTISTPVLNWTLFSLIFNINDVGTHNILFQGTDTINPTNIAITDVQLTKYSMFPALALATNNNLRTTVIYGPLTITDYIANGTTLAGFIKTPKITLNGIDTATAFTTTTVKTDRIFYNYTTAQSFSVNHLGYINSLTYTGSTAITANTYVTLTVNLSMGVYLFDAYALFTITTVNNVVRIGANTVINAVNTNYNYTSTFISNVAQQTVRYNYLSNNTGTTTFYFFYHSASASTLAKFQVNILRIA